MFWTALFFKKLLNGLTAFDCSSLTDCREVTETKEEDASVIRPHYVMLCPPGRQEAVLVDNVREGHRGNRLLAALPPETLAILDRDVRQISLAEGAVMFEPGALLDTIYFPQSGLISLAVVTRNGKTVESATVGREGAVGLHGCMGKRHSFTRATAQIGGIFSTIGASVFGQAVDGSRPVRDLISRYTEVLWAEAQQIAACNAVHNASARMARWLLQSADRTGDDELPVTQEYLAQMLGIRRTTVTLLAQAIQSNELIRYRRGHINILNRGGLEACACEW